MVTNISIRSKNGSESLFLYLLISLVVHLHCLLFANKFPQGQGFIAPTNIISAIYLIFELTLDILTTPSCKGSLKASKTFFENWGNSSKIEYPKFAKATSPIFGLKKHPPPILRQKVKWMWERNGRLGFKPGEVPSRGIGGFAQRLKTPPKGGGGKSFKPVLGSGFPNSGGTFLKKILRPKIWP